MSNLLARMALTSYRWAGIALYPLVRSYISFRAAKGKEDPARKSERFGFPSFQRPDGPLVWIHAASVGETLAVMSLIAEIRQRGIQVVLTTGTVTSAKVAAERLDPSVIHQYVPVDVVPVVSRFLDHWKPDLAILVESEIWPTTVVELGKRHIPQILVNARMSDRSYARWKTRSGIADVLFENFALVIAQSEGDAARFSALGALPVTVSGNLKVENDGLPCNAADLAMYRKQLGKRKTWAAISTFDGEEEAAAIAHSMLKERNKPLTIIVPRHPERSDAVEKMLNDRGLTVARRTRLDPLNANVDIFLGDTIGEVGLYLRLTEVAFVGRSLTAEGGQNPLEPASIGCAILSGSNVQNFRDSYERLAKNGSAKIVRDVEMLAKGVYYLLNNDDARQAMIDAGQQTVVEMRGALAATLRGLEPYINPLTVKARLQTRD
jgi:3-deoxy-D-manno-octulosonic-acid transferase